MNSILHLDSRIAAVMGALVADSASLGLHWLYDPERIAHIEKTHGLVFLQPDPDHYADTKGYFAHGSKISGDASGYGELCLLMACHHARHRQFNRIEYQTEYRNYFGPGGAYVGYVDSPTRLTLMTLLPLKAADYPEKSGADDDQFSALATIPVVVATHTGTQDELLEKVDQVVRLTNHNTDAVSAAQYIAIVLHEVLSGKSIRQALFQALPWAGSKLSLLLNEVLNIDVPDSLAVARRFGVACHVLEGVPVMAHIVQHATSYRHVIEENIRIGGDSCGRAIMLGAIMAAQSAQPGIPLEWLARYRKLSIAADACTLL